MSRIICFRIFLSITVIFLMFTSFPRNTSAHELCNTNLRWTFISNSNLELHTNGKKISNCQDALNSNRSINYTQIYFSPKISADNATFRSTVIAHELDHVMGLGHVPDGASYHSIMKQGHVGYKTPQSHERTDLNSMYGF